MWGKKVPPKILTRLCDMTDPDTRRRIVFLLVCIPVRITLTTLTYWICVAPSWARHTLAGFFAYVSIGFVGQIYRNAQIGGFGGQVWWRWNRYLHAPLYALAIVLLYTRCAFAWIPLLIDVTLALSTGVDHHCRRM